MVSASCGTNGSNLGETYFLKLVKNQAMEIWLLQKQNTTIKLKDMSSPSFLTLPLGKKHLQKLRPIKFQYQQYIKWYL